MALAGAVVASFAFAGNAMAAPSCAYAAGVMTVTLGSGEATTLKVGGGNVQFDDGNGLTDCSPAAPNTNATTSVVVNGAGGSETVDVDFSGGAFLPPITVSLATGTGDTVSLLGSSASEQVTVTNTSFSATGGSGTLSGVENIVVNGNAGDDTLNASATSGGVVLNGSGGDDQLTGGSGADTLDGGSGDDTLTGNAGADALDGGDGNDTIRPGAGSDTNIDCGTGTFDTLSYSTDTAGVSVNLATGALSGGDAAGDTLAAAHGCENATGGSGADTLTGDAGANRLNGGGGNDTLNGAAGNDTLNGEGGNDTLNGGAGNDTENGGDGDDLLNQENASNGADVLTGGTGVDKVDYGARTADVSVTLNGVADDGQKSPAENDNVAADVENISTGTGNDTVNSLGGGTALAGGGGTNTLDFTGAPAGVTVNLATGTGTGSFGQTMIVSGFQNLTGSAFSDVLVGDSGSNVLKGGDANDSLTGGPGNDSLDCGLGTDVLGYNGATGRVEVSLAAGTASGGAGSDTLAACENVVGSPFDDALIGDANGNALDGGGGNDRIAGGGGNDALTGGTGRDVADYSASSTGVTVDLQAGTGSGQGSDTLATFEDVWGSDHADTLLGDSAANQLRGGGGSDRLNGRDGNDQLIGNAGADTLSGGAGNDKGDGGDGRDTIRGGSGDDRFKGGPDRDTLLGEAGNDFLKGQQGNDRLQGGPGNDVLSGGLADDLLLGGAGNDTMNGGPGRHDDAHDSSGRNRFIGVENIF